jgi:hypothetical protein
MAPEIVHSLDGSLGLWEVDGSFRIMMPEIPHCEVGERQVFFHFDG